MSHYQVLFSGEVAEGAQAAGVLRLVGGDLGSLLGLFVGAHRQGDALLRRIDAHHRHLDLVAGHRAGRNQERLSPREYRFAVHFENYVAAFQVGRRGRAVLVDLDEQDSCVAFDAAGRAFCIGEVIGQ